MARTIVDQVGELARAWERVARGASRVRFNPQASRPAALEPRPTIDPLEFRRREV